MQGNEWLEWARGPVFRACLLIMVLGLARVVALNAWAMLQLLRRSSANGRSMPWREIAVGTIQWLFPLKNGLRERTLFSLASMVFHVAIIITPVFLGAHIVIWQRGLGVGWASIPNIAADYLTLVAIVSGLGLFIGRVGSPAARGISRPQDYLLPLLIVIPFASGYLAMHPGINPFGYDGTMFVHVMSGNLLFLVVPFTKISHVALFPATQFVSEIGWHLQPGAGQRVAAALGKEGEPI